MRLSLRPFSLPVRSDRAVAPISVCFVIDRLSRAGTESQLLALLRHLDRNKVQPVLCLLNGDDAETRSLCPADVPTLHLGLIKLASLASIRAAVRLAAFWRKHRVQVVQSYFIDSTYFAAPLARLCWIRHVVRVRNNGGYWLTPQHRRLGKLVGRLCNTLTNSADGARALLSAEGLRKDRVRVIENGVDVEHFAGAAVPDTGRSVVRIGAVANLRPVKNIDGLVRAAARVCKCDPRVQFLVAGEGPERTALQRQIELAGLQERFVLCGSVTDVPAFLASLDVAVLCSHSESMSNALLEYMASGRAIVATDVGANAELVGNEREGLIVPARDDAALAVAIRRLLDDPDLAQRCAIAAQSRAAARYSRAAMVRRFEEFYLSLIESKRGQLVL
jgi:glycosyltransferase involved in cell wall biosynthesis